MMGFGRIAAAWAVLVCPTAFAGNCPHTRTNTAAVSVAGGNWVAAEGTNGDAQSCSDSDQWSAADGFTATDTGVLGSIVTVLEMGEANLVCPTGAYMPQGDATTLAEGGALAADDPEAACGIFGSPPDIIAGNGTHTFFIEDDGDNVPEGVDIFGYITISLTGQSSSGRATDFTMSVIQINGPGVSGVLGVQTFNNGSCIINGTIGYTDTSGQSQQIVFDNESLPSGEYVVQIQTRTASAEGNTFDVSCFAYSGMNLVEWDGSLGEGITSASVGWAYESVAP